MTTSASSAPQGLALAPTAPGRLGDALDADTLRGYLADLGGWRDQRRRELDQLDEASLRAADPDTYTGDVTLSMALWQSVNDRYDDLVRLWDSGRADRITRERMSQLVWGRLDPAAAGIGGLSVSLVEACRLSDALAAQLRARLSFDPAAAQDAVRLANLRAALERLRELVKVEPSWGPQVELLATRTGDLATRAARGGDIVGALTHLESDAARAERDLIVSTATRRELARERDRAVAELVADRVRATNEIAALNQREASVRALATRCGHEIAVAPRLAVPDVDALGPVPSDVAGVAAFLRRLADVVRAMDLAEKAYAAPLAEREELRGRLDGYRVMAARTGRDGDREVATAASLARAAVAAVPCDLDGARRLVAGYQRLVKTSLPPAGATPPPAGASA